MSKVLKLNDRRTHINEPTIDGINFSFDKCPAIQIESDERISIDGPFMYIGDDKIDLEMYTIGTLTAHLAIFYGISTKIFSMKLIMFPALLLADFSNINIEIVDIDNSPTDVEFKIGKLVNNIISSSDISLDITNVYKDGKSVPYQYISNKVFIDHPGVDTKAIVKSKASKFILYVQQQKVIGSDVFVKDRTSHLTNTVLDTSNSFVEGI